MNKEKKLLNGHFYHTKERYVIVAILLGSISLSLISRYVGSQNAARAVEQLAAEEITPLAGQEVVPQPTPEPVRYIVGEASYYSENGCLGCSPTLTMANGETFKDENLTVALLPSDYKQLKNKKVLIINNDNYHSVEAKVTDTGGFGKYNRVADLSKGTKEALKCRDLCNVTIREAE